MTKKLDEHSPKALYHELLDEKEKLNFVYSIGFVVLLVTDSRVIIKRNVSHSLVSFNYQDIEIVEYNTSIRWLYLIFSTLFIISAYVFMAALPGTQASSTIKVSQGVITATQTDPTFNNLLMTLAGMTMVIFGFLFLYRFVLSMFGRLEIFLLNRRKPITIIAKYSPDIPQVINHIERKRGK